MPDHAPTVRAATARDADTLSRLARYDGGTRPAGPTLLAERDGVALAAIGLTSGALTAEPLNPIADVVRLLRTRRYEVLRQGGHVGPAWSLLRRMAPRP
jgi:hypothetical protein